MCLVYMFVYAHIYQAIVITVTVIIIITVCVDQGDMDPKKLKVWGLDEDKHK